MTLGIDTRMKLHGDTRYDTCREGRFNMVSELGERIRLLNNALSCVELVRRFAPSVELRKHSSKELAGECPKCGGGIPTRVGVNRPINTAA